MLERGLACVDPGAKLNQLPRQVALCSNESTADLDHA
jgi:hypothetical protein